MSAESLHPIDCPHARQGSYLNTTNSENPGETIYCSQDFGQCRYARFSENSTAIIDTQGCPLRRKNDPKEEPQIIEKIKDPQGFDY